MSKVKSSGPKGSRKKNNPKPDLSKKEHIAEEPVLKRIEDVPKPETKLAKHAQEADRQPEAVAELAQHDSRKDIQRRFLARQEASSTAEVPTDIHHEEPAVSIVQNEIQTQEATKETELVYLPTRAEEVFAMARIAEKALYAEESTTQVPILPAALHEATPKPLEDLGLVLAADVVSFEEQLEPEVGLRLAELAGPVEAPQALANYDLLEEDEVILLMAVLEQGAVEIDDASELHMVEISASGTAATEVDSVALAEFRAVISVPELPAPVEEIETAIAQLTEILELAEPNEARKVYQILEEIIALPANLETATAENSEILEERLEELFIDLFKETDIEYTPELVMSFIKLTQTHYLEEILGTAEELEAQDLPREIGTREFLQKLQHGLSNMKKAVVHLYEIGKSVLRLYAISKSTTPTSV